MSLLYAGQCCCYTEGSATSPKVLISPLVERQRTVMRRALTLVHTLRQLFPRPPRQAGERMPDTAAASNKQQCAAESPVQSWGGGSLRGKKEKESAFRKGWCWGGVTVKARASSPELSVGSPVSGYHAV